MDGLLRQYFRQPPQEEEAGGGVRAAVSNRDSREPGRWRHLEVYLQEHLVNQRNSVLIFSFRVNDTSSDLCDCDSPSSAAAWPPSVPLSLKIASDSHSL